MAPTVDTLNVRILAAEAEYKIKITNYNCAWDNSNITRTAYSDAVALATAVMQAEQDHYYRERAKFP